MKYVPGCTPENIQYVGNLYREGAFWAIVTAAFTPIPYKVFTIAAGVFSDFVSLHVLIVASIFGRFGRFYLVAACLFFFGPAVKTLLEKYFEWLTFLLLALVILGFLAVKYVF